MIKPYIVGICGGSGSGKTSFIADLTRKFNSDQICLISLDHYYKPIALQLVDQNGKENYDTPESIDIDTFIQDIEKIFQGKSIDKLEYDFNNPNYDKKLLRFSLKPIIIIEGVFVFNFPKIFELFDLKIFIDTDEHLRISRRIKRDLTERGYPIEDTLYYLEHHVVPGYRKYVLPSKNYCDLIISNNNSFEKGLEVVSSFLNTKL